MAAPHFSVTTQLRLFVAASFFVAFALHLLAIPDWLHWLWPFWSGLVLLHCIHRYPSMHFGVFTGGMLGLLLDMLVGGPLGKYALGMALLAQLALALRHRMEFATQFWQQAILILLPLLGLHGICSAVNLLTERPAGFFFGLPALAGALLWPLMSARLETLLLSFERD